MLRKPSQDVKLLVVECCLAMRRSLRQLREPFRSVAKCIDLLPAQESRTPVDRSYRVIRLVSSRVIARYVRASSRIVQRGGSRSLFEGHLQTAAQPMHKLQNGFCFERPFILSSRAFGPRKRVTLVVNPPGVSSRQSPVHLFSRVLTR